MTRERVLGNRVTTRLDASMIGRVDALIPALSTPWREANRSDALRKLILSGLLAEEKARTAALAPPSGTP